MKALIIGLGSMGKRRIRNLHALGYEDVKAYDPREDRVQEAQGKYGITPIFNLEGVLNNSVDIVIVSTPPDHHLEYALMAVEAGKHVFIEASAIDDGLDKLLQLQSKSPIVIAPSSTMRFHPAVKTIKAIVDTKEIGTVLAFSHHFGQYLPKWHPYEDYRTFYVSDPIVGATIELVAFELVWLTWICGIPSKVAAMKGKFGTLDNTIYDLYQVIMQFDNRCIGHLQVDILQRIGNRTTKFLCSGGNITWDWDTQHVTIDYADGTSKLIENTYTDNSPEGFYIDEMAAFISAVQGKIPWGYSINDDRVNLSLLSNIQRSANTNKHVECS